MGNLIALTSITATTGANIVGRALARNGAVTLDSNNISFAACNLPVPALSTWAVIALMGLLAMAGYTALRRRQPLAL